MAELLVKSEKGPVLARMVAAHARVPAPPADRGPAAKRAFGRALRHAAVPFPGMRLEVDRCVFQDRATLSQAIDALPEHGLVAVLEDAEGQRGLLALSHTLVDAVIEVQTTGHVEEFSLPPRPVTQIDEALNRDYIDLFLAAFAREGDAVAGRHWPDRLRFGSRVSDRSQLNLLLPEADYAVFDTALRFEGRDRPAQAVAILPVSTSVAMRPVGASSGEGDPAPTAPEGWEVALQSLLEETPLLFEAVLLRSHRPLGELQSLAVGDVIPFAASDLQTVTLEDAAGRRILSGRLGQIGGKRALRLPPHPSDEDLAAAGQAGSPAPAVDLAHDLAHDPSHALPETTGLGLGSGAAVPDLDTALADPAQALPRPSA